MLIISGFTAATELETVQFQSPAIITGLFPESVKKGAQVLEESWFIPIRTVNGTDIKFTSITFFDDPEQKDVFVDVPLLLQNAETSRFF
jgi:hypothetical protein